MGLCMDKQCSGNKGELLDRVFCNAVLMMCSNSAESNSLAALFDVISETAFCESAIVSVVVFDVDVSRLR